MQKVILVILALGVLGSLWSFFLQETPSCTYEYWINWNTLKFEQACKELKDDNTKKRQEEEDKITEAKKQQKVYNESNNAIRETQDKVANDINSIRQQDSYAFRKAE